MSGGEAFEVLDYAATLDSNMIIIVNDNGPTYAGTIADYLMEQIKVDPTVVAINAGTPGGFGFNAKWCKEANNEELLAMTKYAVHQHEHPVAIRVPVGKFISTGVPDTTDYSILHKSEVTRHGQCVTSFYGLSAMRVKNYGIAKEFHD